MCIDYWKFSFVHPVTYRCCWKFTWSKVSDSYEDFLGCWEVIMFVSTNSCPMLYWADELGCYLRCSVKSIRTCYPQDGAAAAASKTSRIEMLFANKVCACMNTKSCSVSAIFVTWNNKHTIFTILFYFSCSCMLLWSMGLLKMLKKRYVNLAFVSSCAFPPLVH